MSDIALQQPGQSGAWMAEARATVSLAWPLVLTNLVQTAFTTTDVIMLGWLGSRSLAAGALATNLYFAFLIFGIGLVTAAAPMIASEIGRNRVSVRDVRRTVRQGLWSAVAIAVPIWAVLWHAEPILIAFGQEPDLARDAAEYMRTLQWAILPFLGYVVLRSFMAALDRPLWALWVGIFAFLVNAGSAWVLIFGKLGFPALGLTGAGMATTFSNLVMFFGLVLVLVRDRKFRRYRLFGRFWRPDWARFAGVWKLGLPIAAMLTFEVTIFNAAVFLMGLIGADSVAAHAIAIQIASLSFMVPLGIGQAVTVRVGRAWGAGDPDGITRAGWTAYALGVGFMAMTALLMLLAPRGLIGVFVDLGDPDNARVVQLGIIFLGFAALFQIADGAQAVAAGMLRGLHDTRWPMIIALVGYWAIGLPLGAWLGFAQDMEGAGIWIGLATGLAVVAAALTLRWTMRERLGLVPHVDRR